MPQTSSSDFSGSPASLQPQQATPPQDSVPEASTISSCAATESIRESLRSATDGPGFRTTRTTTVEIHRGIRRCTHICECTHMCVSWQSMLDSPLTTGMLLRAIMCAAFLFSLKVSIASVVYNTGNRNGQNQSASLLLCQQTADVGYLQPVVLLDLRSSLT